MPALTVTVPRSASMLHDRGSPATDRRVPVVSAIRLNECPVPRTRSRGDEATSSCSSSTVVGVATRAAANVTFPAQLVGAVAMDDPNQMGARLTFDGWIAGMGTTSGTRI